MTPGLERRSTGHGFTVVELVVTIVILGILAAIAVPRFVGRDTFASRAFFDQATETVRYAQKVSVAWRKPVHVCVTANSIAARTDACPGGGQVLVNPATGAALSVQAPSEVTVAGNSFIFTAPVGAQTGGQPDIGEVIITLTSAGDPPRRIVVERETGYVHN